MLFIPFGQVSSIRGRKPSRRLPGGRDRQSSRASVPGRGGLVAGKKFKNQTGRYRGHHGRFSRFLSYFSSGREKKNESKPNRFHFSFILEMCTRGARRKCTHDRRQRTLRTESTSRSPPPWCTCVGVCVCVRVWVCVRAPVNVYKQNSTAPQSIEQGRSTRTPSTWKRYAPRPHLNGDVDATTSHRSAAVVSFDRSRNLSRR